MICYGLELCDAILMLLNFDTTKKQNCRKRKVDLVHSNKIMSRNLDNFCCRHQNWLLFHQQKIKDRGRKGIGVGERHKLYDSFYPTLNI